jgi:lipoyl(octanoyl) transferase
MSAFYAKLLSTQRLYLCRAMEQQVVFLDLATMEYGVAWELQERLLKENLDRKAAAKAVAVGDEYPYMNPDTRHHLLFCEHPPVYTLGKSGKPENILISANELADKGISYYPTNRGGDITFHGPGQIVGYPILDLEKFYTDIGKYLRNIEEVVIRTIAAFGIKGERSKGETGVWIEPDIKGRERKICAMGVRCSRWITMHGFALNVNTDLDYFNYIIPCGIADKKVTSIAAETGYAVPIADVQEQLKKNFEIVFECKLVTAGL